MTVRGISVDAVDLGARMLYLKEKRSFPMYNHHFVFATFYSVLFHKTREHLVFLTKSLCVFTFATAEQTFYIDTAM